jgi:hypothetical protein
MHVIKHCYTSKSLNWISFAYCLSLVASVPTPLQLVASVVGWIQSVVNVVESCHHNDDTKEALETSHVLGLKEEKWFTGVKHLLTPERAS